MLKTSWYLFSVAADLKIFYAWTSHLELISIWRFFLLNKPQRTTDCSISLQTKANTYLHNSHLFQNSTFPFQYRFVKPYSVICNCIKITCKTKKYVLGWRHVRQRCKDFPVFHEESVSPGSSMEATYNSCYFSPQPTT